MAKGNIAIDVIVILVAIVVFAIFSVIGLRLFTDLNSEIQSDTTMTLNESKQVPQELYSKYPAMLDNAILFAFILLIMSSIISVFFMDSHPVFFFIFTIILVSVFVVSILLANGYDDLMSDDEFASSANQFTYTTYIMTHILQMMIATGFIIGISMFIKFKS